MTKRLVVFQHADATPFAELFDEVVSYRSLLWNTWKYQKITSDDILYFGGGTDIDPVFYGEELGAFSDRPDYARDLYERQAFRDHLGKCGGFLGVCRGSQFLTVMAGGSLVQHCTGHAGSDHDMETDDGKSMVVTSTHHQMMFPWQLPVTDFNLLGWSKPRLSPIYLNGDNGKINVDKIEGFKEPEIVWYPKIRALAIQGHPEYCEDFNSAYPKHCRELIQKYLLK